MKKRLLALLLAVLLFTLTACGDSTTASIENPPTPSEEVSSPVEVPSEETAPPPSEPVPSEEPPATLTTEEEPATETIPEKTMSEEERAIYEKFLKVVGADTTNIDYSVTFSAEELAEMEDFIYMMENAIFFDNMPTPVSSGSTSSKKEEIDNDNQNESGDPIVTIDDTFVTFPAYSDPDFDKKREEEYQKYIKTGDPYISRPWPVDSFVDEELDAKAVYLLTVLPNETFAYDLRDFKADLTEIIETGIRLYVRDDKDINPESYWHSYMEFTPHTNAEAREFIANYVRNFDPSYLFADQYPPEPEDWSPWENYYDRDYVKFADDIAFARENWELSLEIVSFAAVTDETPVSWAVEWWQTGDFSDAGLTNYLNYWIAGRGIYSTKKIYSH